MIPPLGLHKWAEWASRIYYEFLKLLLGWPGNRINSSIAAFLFSAFVQVVGSNLLVCCVDQQIVYGWYLGFEAMVHDYVELFSTDV